MTSGSNPAESDFDRLTRQIAELDLQESELLGLNPSKPEVPSPDTELALAAIREQRRGLKEELAALWARRSNRC